MSTSDPWAMLRDPETIVFVNGHEVGCEHHHTCDCDDRYIAIFNRCPECAEELDEYGDCPNDQEHAYGL